MSGFGANDFATSTPGREPPSGTPSGRQETKAGGLLCTPLNQRDGVSSFGARHRAPRLLLEFSACKSSAWRDLQEKTSRTPLPRRSFSTDSLAFPSRANHRHLLRPPRGVSRSMRGCVNQGGDQPTRGCPIGQCGHIREPSTECYDRPAKNAPCQRSRIGGTGTSRSPAMPSCAWSNGACRGRGSRYAGEGHRVPA
jgi:hypothetical protein